MVKERKVKIKEEIRQREREWERIRESKIGKWSKRKAGRTIEETSRGRVQLYV